MVTHEQKNLGQPPAKPCQTLPFPGRPAGQDPVPSQHRALPARLSPAPLRRFGLGNRRDGPLCPSARFTENGSRFTAATARIETQRCKTKRTQFRRSLVESARSADLAFEIRGLSASLRSVAAASSLSPPRLGSEQCITKRTQFHRSLAESSACKQIRASGLSLSDPKTKRTQSHRKADNPRSSKARSAYGLVSHSAPNRAKVIRS